MSRPVLDDRTLGERTLVRTARRFRSTIAFGALFAVLGASYAVFAAAQFGSPRVHESFDRPIARMGLVVQGCGAARRQFEPASEREAMLLLDLEKHAATSGQLVVLLLRGLIASMLFSTGLAGVAAGAAQAHLLRAFAGVGVLPAGDGAGATQDTLQG